MNSARPFLTLGPVRRLPVRWSARRWRPRLIALGALPVTASGVTPPVPLAGMAGGQPLRVHKSLRISLQPVSRPSSEGAWGPLTPLPVRTNPQFRYLA